MSYKVIIDIIANGQKAVTEFDKAGRAAERMAKKTTDEVEKTRISTEKLGRQAGIIGVSMLGAAGSIAFAMRGWVKSAQEAEQAQMRLESSVRGSYGAASKAVGVFEAQAKALQKVTVASDEDVMSIQALLVQFGLTQRQVTTLTPLVVDISRKWGIDYVSAAKAVAKAADGKATALKKLGINVDEAKAKTDPYIATVEALRRAAGGFAQEEGKTFAGQTAILANQMDELKESLGRGVLNVLNRTLPAVNAVAGGFTSLDDATGGLVGSTTAVGTGLLAIAGAAGVTLKAVLALKAAYAEAADAQGLMGAITRGGAAAFGPAGAVALGFAIGSSIGNALNDRVFHLSEKADEGYREVFSAKNGAMLMKGYVTAAGAEAARGTNILTSLFKTFGKAAGTVLDGTFAKGEGLSKADFFTIAGEAGFDKAFAKVAAGSQEAAQGILDYAEAHPKAAARMEALGFNLEKYQERMRDVNDVNKDGKTNLQDLELATKQTTDAVSTLEQVLSTGGAVTRGFSQAQIDLARAQQGVTDAQKAYTEAVKSGDPAKVKDAQLGLQAAMLSLASAQDQAREAAFKHGEMLLALKTTAGNAEAFNATIDKLKEMREILTDPAEKKAIEDRIDALVELRISAGQKIDLNDGEMMASLWRLAAAGRVTEAQIRQLKTIGKVELDTSQAVDALRNVGTAAELSRRQLMAIQVLTQGFGRGVLSLETQLKLAQRIAMTGETPEQALANLRGRASGGPVSANTAYMVGEQGPELFVPSSSGTIIPNGALNGGTSIGGLGTVININVASSALSTPAETGAAVVDALTAWQRRNGRLPLQVA